MSSAVRRILMTCRQQQSGIEISPNSVESVRLRAQMGSRARNKAESRPSILKLKIVRGGRALARIRLQSRRHESCQTSKFPASTS
jgi:hypothetical protein